MTDGTDRTTRLLRAAAAGDEEARDEAWGRIHAEVLAIAAAQRGRWSGDWTLETRALANEVFLKLYSGRSPEPRDRGHFFALLAKAVRQVLVNYSEARRAQKRGGGVEDVPLDEAVGLELDPEVSAGLLDLHGALERFEAIAPRPARVVELRFFGGLAYEEIAEALGISRATAVRDWEAARAWLAVELGEAVTTLAAAEDPPTDP